MPQSDFLITGGAAPEGSGLNVRLRIQAAFLAAISHSCGATEPTTPYPHMFWVDETNGLLKQRNITNDAWITKWDITKGQLATLASPTFTGIVNLPTTSYIGGVQIAKTVSPVFSGNAVFESLTASIGVSLPANTTIGAVSATELSYLDGVTSLIQSQLNALSTNKANQSTTYSKTEVDSIVSAIVINPSEVFSNSQTFTSSGTFIVPTGVTKLYVIGCGGGGGGGLASATYSGTTVSARSGGGGGSGGHSIIDVSENESITITIGSGGAANGGNGGNTLFGNYLNFVGGFGGSNASATSTNASVVSNGGWGIGNANGGNGNSNGYPSIYGYSGGVATNNRAGGGASIFSNGSDGGVASGYGAGGSGAFATRSSAQGNGTTSSNGLAGGAGKVIVYW